MTYNQQLKEMKPYFFVEIWGEIKFEGESITECKNYIKERIASAKIYHQDITEDLANLRIGMYDLSFGIED